MTRRPNIGAWVLVPSFNISTAHHFKRNSLLASRLSSAGTQIGDTVNCKQQLKGDGSYLPNRCSGLLQIAISLIPLTLQLSFFAKCFLFNISLSGSNHNHIW